MDSLQLIEYDIALLVRLTTSPSRQIGNLDRSEFLLLSELDKHGPLGINELSDQLRLNVSTASRQVAAMESKEFIRRYPDPKNGRISLIVMTKEGQEILHNAQKSRQERLSDILKDWSEEDLNVLQRNLTRLNQDIKNWKQR
ncbi:MarR family transcriptional regulator [Peribacillus frigoritolerans]|uniref:MarR family transcriptional regulator n=2 Tax=Peribacillus TaxID=2675229 RepID=A0AAJ1VBC8_9BACI|nr:MULTISPECIES: MarR family transcriptional regulator [Bacillaceae]KOR78682.1 MarR family transcriptional regulator [Bacillus sp. FJAT-21352]KOR83181.1 MarR family transcriptional regulator [Bacillus sp. FJAT-22058]MBD8137476.1 MarR family transcriptional regulator [Bacillus sp. CFBP 13597]MBT2604451.1 MarR family transcriptional regulator [Bacillus sp. ISL-53]MCD1160956.1 MarR family transcriptional regulator [Peribacillus castrilensis]MDP9741312.1 DNA-binding MarR family transcriptional re